MNKLVTLQSLLGSVKHETYRPEATYPLSELEAVSRGSEESVGVIVLRSAVVLRFPYRGLDLVEATGLYELNSASQLKKEKQKSVSHRALACRMISTRHRH